MARPIKNNADYFPHDADMRNDPKVKAVRRKFGLDGYAIYSMLIEFLTDSEYFEFKNDSLTIEIIAGDFDIAPEKLTEIINYCIQIDLLQVAAKTKIVSCKSLDKRLEPLLSKRKRDRIEVIADDNTQSKVKESKVNKNKEKESKAVDPLRALILPFGDSFKVVWNEWVTFRKELKKKLTLSTAQKQINFLGARAENEAIEIINQSITNGWTGLFDIKTNGHSKPKEVKEKLTLKDLE